MNVAMHLGVADPDSEVLVAGRSRWPEWQRDCAALRPIDELADLPGWLRAADRESADRVMLALAELSSPHGGDDTTATGMLTWVLVPGAVLLAFRLSPFSRRIDEILAAQLWLEARTFPWQHGHKVAANILMNTRRRVLRDLGVTDAAAARVIPLPPTADVWTEAVSDAGCVEPAPEDELAEILTVARRQGVLSEDDIDLLLSLAGAADAAKPARSGRGHAGLMAPAASDVVAAARGVSSRTVRRRALDSVTALRAVCHAQQPTPA